MSTTELLNSSRSLLLASYNWYGLVVNFYNIWTKKEWHILNPPINRDTKQINTWEADHTLCFCIWTIWIRKNRGFEFWIGKRGSQKLNNCVKNKAGQNVWYNWFKNKPQCPDPLWVVVYSISSATHTHKHEFYGTWSISLYFLTGLKLFQCSMWAFLNKTPAAVVQTWITAPRYYWTWKAKIMFLANNYVFKILGLLMFCSSIPSM